MNRINRSLLSCIILVIFLFPAGLTAQIPLVPYDSVVVVEDVVELMNPWSGGLNCPQFSTLDLNDDGLKDLVVFERNFYGGVKTFINRGAANQVDYHYAPQYQSRFPQMRNWMLLRDYNCDGKEDIFTSVPAGVAVYRNDTEPGGKLKFTLVTPLLQTIGLDGQTPLYVSPPDIPAIADIDNDGDLDFLSFDILGNTVEYHRNFSLENNGDCETLDFELRNACWGFFSEAGTTNSVTLFDTCDLNVPDPEKAGLHAGSTILALDLTGNGVKDLVLGDLTYTNLVKLVNGGTVTSSGMTSSDTLFPSNTTPVDLTVFPASYYLDVNNDDQQDLLVAPNNPNTSENFDNIWYYKNIATGSPPEFSFQHPRFLQDGMVDAGERSFAVFFDENADGLQDIILGNFGYFIASATYSSQLMLLRNTGTTGEPAFELVDPDYHNLSLLGFHGLYPAFGDMDADGDEDMITGDEDGLLHYFRNDAGPGNAAQFTLSQANYKGIDVGQSAKPQIIDANRDGLPDLVVGERSGTVNYYQNTGTPETADFPALPTNDFFGQIDVMPACCTGYSAPFMAEDSTGNYLLYVGSEQGYLYLFNNIENNLDGAFNPVDSLYLQAALINPAGADLTDDQRLELVFGQLGGGMGLLKYGIPPGLGIHEREYQNLSLHVSPNPATNTITIQVADSREQALTNFNLRILNSLGQSVQEFSFIRSAGSENLPIDKLQPGIYFIAIHSDKGTGIAKLIVR